MFNTFWKSNRIGPLCHAISKVKLQSSGCCRWIKHIQWIFGKSWSQEKWFLCYVSATAVTLAFMDYRYVLLNICDKFSDTEYYMIWILYEHHIGTVCRGQFFFFLFAEIRRYTWYTHIVCRKLLCLLCLALFALVPLREFNICYNSWGHRHLCNQIMEEQMLKGTCL